jgi:hypothetical protein
MADQEADYEIGYGKPPRANQFPKGVSGNRSGRPKGARSLNTIVLKESRQQIRVNGPRGVRSITKLEAAVMQLANKSAQGDLRATRELIPLIARSEDIAATGEVSLPTNEQDQKRLANLRRRLAGLQPDPNGSE